MLPIESQVMIFPNPDEGIVEVAITTNHSGGRVKWLGSYWPAKFYRVDSKTTVLPGERVLIVGIQGITILVVPV